MKLYKKSYIIFLFSIMFLCLYPIYMGARVVIETISNGSVDVSTYPKYIIPYTPISIALLIGVCLIPVAFNRLKKHSLLFVSTISTIAFFICENYFENIYVLDGPTKYEIETWQMLSCFAQPDKVLISDSYKAIAGYSAAFKIHFYIIAIVMILAIINTVLGFYKMHKSEKTDMKKPLIVQLISVVVFLTLSIFACFTAFYRTGGLEVSLISAILMTIFFVVFGMTVGSYFGTLFFRKSKLVSVFVPAIMSSLTTFIMFLGEMILLDGNLYRFGDSWLFVPIETIVLSVFDIITIFLSAVITYFIMLWINSVKGVYGTAGCVKSQTAQKNF